MRALQGVLALCLVGCIHPTDDPPMFPISIEDMDIPYSMERDPTFVERIEGPLPAPRLRHSKTLGQSEFDGRATPTVGGATAQGESTIVIHNNIQQTTNVVVPYAVPGLVVPSVNGGGTPSARSGNSAGASHPPSVGGDWPQVPSYGPR